MDSAISTADVHRTDVLLLIAYVLIALFFSFLCSVSEAVLLSITPSYIEGLRSKKQKRAEMLKTLRLDNVDRSLAAILTLNTIAHTVGAIAAGAKATDVFGSAWIGLFSVVITLMILFFSEIIPKTLGAVYWSNLAWITAYFIRGIIIVLYPLIRISESLTKIIASGKIMHVFSREEFMAMASIGEKMGHIEKHESRIIRNLFRFGSLSARDIMTPRTVISALPEDLSISEAAGTAIRTAFSRLPVYGKEIGDVTGFVLKDEILMLKSQQKNHVKLSSIKREITGVPENISLVHLLEFFLDNRRHIALVIDEHGGIRGLVTLEDVVETLLGMEIIDEMDKITDMRVLARKRWADRAKALGIEADLIDDF
ncbi:MAG: hemolysin family protein [Desulfobacterales bacterium]